MPRPARITRSEVIASALQLADEQGLAAVTMSAVAARLGVTPMALYAHVDSKEHLLDLLVEAVLCELPGTDDVPDGWSQLEILARALRETAGRHPAVFPLLLQRPAVAGGSLRLRARIRDALHACGVPVDAADRGERLVSTIALGFIASETSGRFAEVPPEQRDADFELLLELVRQGLPVLHRRSSRQ
jgi:AcrR family transcriptional regulator